MISTTQRGEGPRTRCRLPLHCIGIIAFTLVNLIAPTASHADRFDCTEQGLLDAIAQGGGPHVFDCSGPSTVTTSAEIVIANDVILDGEGRLTIDGGGTHRVFKIHGTVGLWNLTVSDGYRPISGSSIDRGGGIMNRGGTVTLFNSTISGNTASAGGGISNELGGAVTLIDSSVDGNIANSGGGVMNLNGTTLDIIGSTISGNSASLLSGGRGGGIFNDGTLIVINSTISGNSGANGGGIHNGIADVPTLRLTNSTIALNTPANVANAGAFITANSLLHGSCSLSTFGGSVSSLGGNLESPGDTCDLTDPTDQVGIPDPGIGPLADNGGPTFTHMLLPGSDAIDAGTAAECMNEDQRGVPRAMDGDGDTVQGCDVGAVEACPLADFDLIVASQVVDTSEVFEACRDVVAGPELEVRFPGVLTLRGCRQVVLRSGFAVEDGAVLVVENPLP